MGTGAVRTPGADLSSKAVRIACNTCRKTKLRCSRERPSCSNCRRGGHECVYESKRHKPGIRAGAIETIYKRLDALERAVFESQSNADASTKATIERQRILLGDLDEAGDDEGSDSDSPSSPRGDHTVPDDAIQVDQPGPAITGIHHQYDQPGSLHAFNTTDQDEPYPQLPPFPLIETIVTVYFSHVHPWIPMLNQDRFRSRLQSPPHEIQKLDIILHAMFVATCRYLLSDQQDAEASVAYRGWSLLSLRRWVVSMAMDNLSIQGLQALIIIAFDDLGSGNASKAWSIIASLTRTVEYCQLTMAPDRSDRQPICRPYSYLPPPKDWTQQEERRRIFWNIFILDRFCSISMGWNISLTSDDVRQRLPSDGILWRKDEAVVTPYLGVWDKSTGRGGGSMAAPVPQSPSEVLCDAAIENDPRNQSAGSYLSTAKVDMSKVGQFAYCVEATESMSRVTNYFLQQRFNPKDPKEVEWWLTRFKELDLRLAHWKILLPQKWTTTTTAPRQQTATATTTNRLDPNLTLAHVTHNASTILLHQLIAYPPPSWPFRRRLPSTWSAETCCSAGAEICTITQQYLRSTPSNMPITSQYAFCVYIAARMMLLHWQQSDSGTELQAEFWPLVDCLEEMARRWKGLTPSHTHHTPGATNSQQVLSGKYASKLRELWGRSTQDKTFRIDVTDYTREIDHRQAPTFRPGGPSTGPSPAASWNTRVSDGNRQWTAANQDMGGMLPYGRLEDNTSPVSQHHPLHKASTPYGTMPGQDQLGFSDMNFGGSMGIDNDYFMNLDRVIAFEDGSLFTTNMENNAW